MIWGQYPEKNCINFNGHVASSVLFIYKTGAGSFKLLYSEKKLLVVIVCLLYYVGIGNTADFC